MEEEFWEIEDKQHGWYYLFQVSATRTLYCSLVITRDDTVFAVAIGPGSASQCWDAADSKGAYEHHTESLQRCVAK